MLQNRIQKELIYISADKSVEKVHIGVFPVKDRYFRKEMKHRGHGYFQVTLDLPKGKSFYHYFLNEDFQNPINNNLNVISEHDTHMRSPLVLETEMFSPIKFENNNTFINHVKDDLWDFRVISYQKWIENITIVINGEQYPLEKHFTNKNKSFWHTRIELKCSEIKYYIKTSNGVSHEYSTHRHQPFWGAGQGACDASARCTATSSTMFLAYDQISKPLIATNPQHTHIHVIRIGAFVDDAKISVSFDKHASFDEVTQAITHNATRWEQLLWATGGKLEIEKCTIYIITWEQESNGY